MRKILITVGFFLGLTQSLFAATATSVSRYGITWTFGQAAETGQYANGDYWVVGPVTITSVSPAPGTGRNGSVVNPRPGDNQGYDDRVGGYTASLRAAFPLTLQPGQSLVSTESHADAAGCVYPGNAWGQIDYTGDCSRSILKRASVLMAVAAPVAAGTFRPPYVGTSRPVHTTAQIYWSRLPKIAPVTGTLALATFERHFERTWLDHKNNWDGAYMHPTENMYNYGAYLADVSGQAALLLTLNYTNAQKEPLLYSYIQLGIDLYGMLLNGRSWYADGGHHSGRKLPILLAGWLLDDAGMKSIGTTHAGNNFAENGQTYYNNGTAAYGIRVYENNYDQNYFEINMPTWPAEALAARIFGIKELWNHNAFFDLCDANTPWSGKTFVYNMWATYRNNLPAVRDKMTAGAARPELLKIRQLSGSIQFDLSGGAATQKAALRIYDQAGTQIESCAGTGRTVWENNAARTGIYYYTLRVDNAAYTGKLIKF